MTGYEDLDAHGTWRTVPEYGAVWVPARVERGWAPYRHGHWSWIAPWGWTWVDDAPWGFAPFHYGRWVMVHDHWAWAPGAIVRRPVYAPALVAFVGGSSWGVSFRSGPAVGWFPLGWREPYRPWYRASHAHTRNVNVTQVTNVYNTTNVTHVHRHVAEAVTVVPQETFVSARSIGASRVRVAQGDLATAQLIQDRSPAAPLRASVAPERPGQRPPAQAAAREVVAVSQPSVTSRDLQREPGLTATRLSDAPRVRVLGRERDAVRAHVDTMQERRSTATPAVAPASTPAAAVPPAALAAPAAPAASTVAATPAPRTSDAAAAAARPAAAQAISSTPAAPTVRSAPVPIASAPAPAASTAAAAALPSVAVAPAAAGPLQTRADTAPPAAAPVTRPPQPAREAPAQLKSIAAAGPAATAPSAAVAAPPRADAAPRVQRALQPENAKRAGAPTS